MNITLVAGDWSDDGHGKTSNTYIHADTPHKEDVEEAYRKGTEIVGFDLINDVASEYDEASIRKDWYLRLVELGYTGGIDGDLDDTEVVERVSYEDGETVKEIHVSGIYDAFAEMYIFIVNLGDPYLQARIIPSIQINIGGYGLFS